MNEPARQMLALLAYNEEPMTMAEILDAVPCIQSAARKAMAVLNSHPSVIRLSDGRLLWKKGEEPPDSRGGGIFTDREIRRRETTEATLAWLGARPGEAFTADVIRKALDIPRTTWAHVVRSLLMTPTVVVYESKSGSLKRYGVKE